MAEAPRRPGRPSKGDRVTVRLDSATRAAVRRWAAGRDDVDRRAGQPVEADAVRCMVVRVLAEDSVPVDGDQPEG